MTDKDAEVDHPLPPRTPDMTLVTPDNVMQLKPDSFQPVPGLPFEQRVTDVAKLSGGTVGVSIVRKKPNIDPAEEAASRVWHLHHGYEFSIGYIVSGWGLFEYEGIGQVRLEAGTVTYQTPMNRHRQLDSSPDYEVISITVPDSRASTKFVYDEASGSYQ